MKLFKLFKSLWKYLKQDKWKFYLFVIITFTTTLFSLLYGYLFGHAVSYLIAGNFNKFVLYILLYDGYALIAVLLVDWLKTYLRNKLQINFMKRVSKDLYTKALNLPVTAYDKHSVGEIINRIYTDPDTVIGLLDRIVRSTARIIAAISIVIYSITASWVLTLEFVIVIAITFGLSRIYYPKMKKTQESIKKISDHYVGDSNQVLFGIRDVKGLGLKPIMGKLMSKNVDNLYDKQLKSRSYEMYFETLISAIHTIFEVVIFISLGYMAYKGHIAMSVFLAYEWYIWRIFDVAREVTQLGTEYQKVVVSMTRIDEYLNNKIYNDEQFGDKVIDKIKGNIEFKNVYFSYNEDKKVLNNLSMTIETGKKIAIVGKSGMGKSTIFNLLLRFYQPTNGEILIDGIKIEDFSEDSLRKHISIIRQDPYVFNKTIKENFELVQEDITLEQIRKLCKKVYIDDYIMGLPDKYDTVVGEGGVTLSGGQKQRISIARALAKNTKIILFDESTSALDNESQAYIKKTIDQLASKHTVVIIAHRLSTIVDADLIFLVDEGTIVGMGTHAELLESNEIYRKLYTPELLELNI